MTSPIDADVRQRAAHEITSSLALTAGAGSGKTTVLVDRVLQLLRAGTPPQRIVAITFTEKAAGELEQRVREALEDALQDDPDDPGVLDCLHHLSEMQLSTIHSFCQVLLVEEALAAAWNPDAELVDAAFSTDATNQAYEVWWRLFEKHHPDAALLVHEIISENSLRALAGMLMDYRDLEPLVDAARLDWIALDSQRQRCTDEIFRRAQMCAVPDDDTLSSKNHALMTVLRHAAERPNARARVSFVIACQERGGTSGGRQGDWGGKEHKQAFADAIGAYLAWCDDVSRKLHALVVTHLREHFVGPALELKAELGEYDFQDLLFQSAELLADSPAARARLASRYDAILIDEVQDTDPIQAEVAMLLARDPRAEGAWNEHPPRPGALFAVGDPKQSIYRFRRADVRTWRALRDTIAADGRSLSLTTNFRSVPGIVDWVNAAFAEMPEYEPQAAFRDAGEFDPVVLLETGELGSDEAVTRYIHRLLVSDTRVADRVTNEMREVRQGDIMVLLPSWTAASGMQAQLLACGIDAVVEGGRTFFGRDETRLLLAAMRSIEEPADAEATVFVMRGLFGFDHQALLDFVQADGTWRYTIRDQPAGPIARALDILRALHFRRDRQSWVQTLDELLDECWAPAVWAGMLDGKSRLANVAKFHSLVREAERTAATPGDTVRAMEELAKQDDQRELPVVDFDADAVRITTYFSAKGLEAPIVLLAHSKRAIRIDNYGAAAVVDREDRTVALRISGLEPENWGTAQELEKAEYAEEQRRWMYVAATRARDQLVIVRADRENLLDYDIARGLPTVDESQPGNTFSVGRAAVHVLDAASLPTPDTFTAVFPNFGDIETLLEAGTVTTHSTLQSRDDQMRDAIGASRRASTVWRSVGQIVKKSRRARKYEDGVGAAGGTVVHLTMANLDLSQPVETLETQLPALVDAFAASEGLEPETADKCFKILSNMLRHPVVERARTAPERWVEAPFTFKERGRIVSGIIDLCFPVNEERTNWVVVDWKSNLPPEGTPERESYEQQLAYYARALIAAVTPCDNVETVLVGPHPELLAPDELTEALELVDEDLAEVLANLVAAGVAVPEIGLDVGEPIVGMLELAWPDEHFGVGLDLTAIELMDIRAAGYKVVAVETTDPHWTELVYQRVSDWFDVAVENADDTDASGEAEPSTSPPEAEVDRPLPVAQSSLSGTHGVVAVHEQKRIAYAEDLPRHEMLKLVASGWMVVAHNADEHHSGAPVASDEFPFSEREVLDAWAQRFDGHRFVAETGFEVPRDAATQLASGEWNFAPLEELAIFFAQHRYLSKWGGEQLPADDAQWQFYRTLFLRTATYEIPEEWRSPQNYERWQRIYLPHRARALTLVGERQAALKNVDRTGAPTISEA